MPTRGGPSAGTALRLLTPNWLSRLPGFAYEGEDPDGFMTMPEVVEFIDRYAAALDAPVRTGTTVTKVCAAEGGYRVETDAGSWEAPTVMLASGAFNLPHVPDVAAGVPDSVAAISPLEYRRPDQLPAGGVLVVGASATGLQLADEIHRSGRPVTLSVGEHVRMPRTYRGRDAMWWMTMAGVLDERYDEIDDVVRGRNIPSPQLVGTPARATLDLNALTRQGVELVGRLGAIRDGVALFSGSLRNVCALADLKLGRLLDRFDAWALEHGVDGDVDPPHRLEPTRLDRRAAAEPRSSLRGDRSDRLGDRVPARLLVAGACRCSTAGAPASRRRRGDGRPRHVRDRPQPPPPPQVDLHPRGRGRRPRAHRPPRRPPRATVPGN